jgi:hypothetical protein
LINQTQSSSYLQGKVSQNPFGLYLSSYPKWADHTDFLLFCQCYTSNPSNLRHPILLLLLFDYVIADTTTSHFSASEEAIGHESKVKD